MSNNESEEASVERIELHLHLDLPADAPRAHLHIINLKATNRNHLAENLIAVDAIASCL